MVFQLKNFGTIDVTYETLRVNDYEVKDNLVMSLVLKAKGWFNHYKLTDLQIMGYEKMYEKLCRNAEMRGLI